MDDLLKEAIADAKAVRETALENAKMALEEAFTPRLQNMLSQKIQNEMEDEEGEEYAEQEDEEDVEDVLAAQDEVPGEEAPADDEEAMLAAQDEFPGEEAPEEEPEMEEEGVIEINGVKYAPVVSEEEEEDEEAMEEQEDEEEEGDLDLEAVIKELEDELEESENPYDNNEQHDDMKKVAEQSDSSDIGKADNKVDAADAGDEEDPGKGKLKEQEGEDEEDVDLDEVLKALSEQEDEEEEVEEVAKLRSDLDEHRSVIETLRGKLNEVNLLNAKLLFTNKLFRKYGLNNEQKMKVVEQFDRAGTLREVKLVYSTLGESFGVARKNINESKGAASKPVASTKSDKKVISEGNDLRDRFKKLANLI
jgi:hypothetical protein